MTLDSEGRELLNDLERKLLYEEVKEAEEAVERKIPEFDLTSFNALVSAHRFDENLFSIKSIVGYIKDVIYRTESKEITAAMIELMKSEYYISRPSLASHVSNAIMRALPHEGANNDCGLPFIELFDSDAYHELMDKLGADVDYYMQRYLGSMVQFVGSAEPAKKLVDLLGSYAARPEVAEIVLDKATTIHISLPVTLRRRRGSTESPTKEEMAPLAEAYVDVFNLDPTNFGDCVYDELLDYIVDNPAKAKEFGSSVKQEKDFLNQQTSETVFPLAAIMFELGERYHDKIKELNDFAKLRLAQAYSIARDNVNEKGENYLEAFYAGLKGTLDTRPENLTKWANQIVQGFKERGDEYLRKVA